MPRTGIELWTTLKRPEFVYGGIICLLFVVGLSMPSGWAHSRKVPYAGQLVEHAIVNLVDYEVEDPQATERERVEARNSSAIILTPNVAYLDRLEASIDGLPRAVAERKSLEEVNPELVSAFALTPETLAEVPDLHRRRRRDLGRLDEVERPLQRPALAQDPPAQHRGLPGLRDDPQQGRTDSTFDQWCERDPPADRFGDGDGRWRGSRSQSAT